MIRGAIWIGFFLRLFVAIWFSATGEFFGIGADAMFFHGDAAEFSKNLGLAKLEVGHFYSYALAVVYSLTTDSVFIGCFLTVLAWVASAFVLLKTMRLLRVDSSLQGKALLVYALLPSSVIYTGVTLREAYQLLFVNLAIFSALKIYLEKSSRYWLLLLFAALAMGTLHGALYALGLYIVIATFVLLAFRGRKGLSFSRLLFASPLIAVIAYYGISLFSSIAYKELDDGLVAGIRIFQEGALGTDARANYKESVSIENTMDLLVFLPVSFVQYLFEPFPWRSLTAQDAGLMLENLLRAWLIWKAIAALRAMPPHGMRPVLFVFSAYLVVEAIWSVGTINWGTASRHHLPALGMLLVAAFAYARAPHRRRASIAAAG